MASCFFASGGYPRQANLRGTLRVKAKAGNGKPKTFRSLGQPLMLFLIRGSIPHIARSAGLDLSKPPDRERWHIHTQRTEATPL